MAIAGKSGSLYVGAVPSKVAELTDWSLDLKGDNIDVTNLDSNGWKEYLAGLKGWSGKASANFKFTDTNGQKAIFDAAVAGTAIAGEFRLGGASPKFTGSVLVSGLSVDNPLEGKVKVSFDVQGTGALTYTP